jgi:hypothetical protein
MHRGFLRLRLIVAIHPNRVVQNSRSCADRRDGCHRLVQCGVTIDARYGTNDPDNSCPPTKPELTFDSDAAGSLGFTAVYFEPTKVFKAKSLRDFKLGGE